MHKRKVAGIITALLGVVGLIALLNASSSEPIINWPLEAYLGVVFTIGWLTSVPDWSAYVLAVLVFVVVIGIFHKLGTKIYELIVKRN